MWALLSLVDDQLYRVSFCGIPICCIFNTEEEAKLFQLKHKIVARIERVKITDVK